MSHQSAGPYLELTDDGKTNVQGRLDSNDDAKSGSIAAGMLITSDATVFEDHPERLGNDKLRSKAGARLYVTRNGVDLSTGAHLACRQY